MLFLIAFLPLKKSVTNHVDQGWGRPRGTRESVQEARTPHGGENASKVPPGPGFRVYIDRLRRAAGSRSEVVKGPGRPGWQAGQQTGMAGPAPGGGQWRPARLAAGWLQDSRLTPGTDFSPLSKKKTS